MEYTHERLSVLGAFRRLDTAATTARSAATVVRFPPCGRITAVRRRIMRCVTGICLRGRRRRGSFRSTRLRTHGAEREKAFGTRSPARPRTSAEYVWPAFCPFYRRGASGCFRRVTAGTSLATRSNRRSQTRRRSQRGSRLGRCLTNRARYSSVLGWPLVGIGRDRGHGHAVSLCTRARASVVAHCIAAFSAVCSS